MANLKALAKSLVSLTTEEANKLANILKDEYGIVFSMKGPFVKKYTIVLKKIENRRFTRLQLRKILGISFEEAEEILNNLPYEIHVAEEEEAKETSGMLRVAGATIEIKFSNSISTGSPRRFVFI